VTTTVTYVVSKVVQQTSLTLNVMTV